IPDFQALQQFLERMGFRSIIRQAASLLEPFMSQQSFPASNGEVVAETGSTGGETPGAEAASLPQLQALSADYLQVDHTVVTTQTQLQTVVDHIRQAGVFALDIETTGLDVHTVQLAGIAVSVLDAFERFDRPAENILKLQDYPPAFPALRLKK